MKANGFSLIELMIVVAIIGILAMIGYPSYQQYVLESRRADAMSSVLSLQLAQQRVRANCRFYAGTPAGADACGANAGATTVNASATSLDGFYTLAVSNVSGNSYTITATAAVGGSQVNDTGCTAMVVTINNANPDGLKTPADCW